MTNTHKPSCPCEKHLAEGLKKIKNEQYAEAIAEYQAAIDVHNDNASAWGQMGFCYNMLGDNIKALTCYDLALSHDPSYKYAWNNKGTLLIELGRLEQAYECFMRAVEIDPSYEQAVLNAQKAEGELNSAFTADIDDLRIIEQDELYFIEINGFRLTTPQGRPISSNSKKLMNQIIDDFKDQGEIVVNNGIIMQPRIISAYLLESTKLDFIDEGDTLAESLPPWLSADPIFTATAGHPIISMYQINAQDNAQRFLQEKGFSIKSWDKYSDNERESLIHAMQSTIDQFSAPQKSALINLACPSGGHYINSIVYLLGRYTEKEWATAVFSRTPDVCRIIGDIPVSDIGSIPDESSAEDRAAAIEKIIKSYINDCMIIKRYLNNSK